ncbi:Gfo/Idh/MocA family oxidoreductase [candidate division KSB1 bacterium]|nr:Gfo/Idh/MocA family oxidoreductase [candidate division KSB1 bacterium]
MSKIKIGFVGTGGMGQMAHLHNYAVLDTCEVVALAELRPETGKLVAARYGVPRVYDSHSDMLANEKLDAIVASQPFDRHSVLLPDLYAAVPFLFTEKPLATSVEAGEKLVEASKKHGCVHMVGYHKRSDPATIYTKELISEWQRAGKLGAMKYIRILMPAGDWIARGFTGLLNTGEEVPALEREPMPADMKPEIAEKYVSFVNYYIHQVNLMRYLLGEPYTVAFAESSGVVLAVESKSGIPGIIEMTPYQTTVEWEESALIAFAKGYIKLRLPAPLAVNRAGTVEIYRDPGQSVPERIFPTLPWVHAMHQQAINFVKVCRGEGLPPCDASEAVEDLKIAREYIRMRFEV